MSRLVEMLMESRVMGRFILSSGELSEWYIDCRKVTGTEEGLRLASAKLLHIAEKFGCNALVGPGTSSIPLMAGALCHGGLIMGVEKFAYTRDVPKNHGTALVLEGAQLEAGDKVLLVDDVINTGTSLLRCHATLREKHPDVKVVGAWGLFLRKYPGNVRNLIDAGIGSLRWACTEEQIGSLHNGSV